MVFYFQGVRGDKESRHPLWMTPKRVSGHMIEQRFLPSAVRYLFPSGILLDASKVVTKLTFSSTDAIKGVQLLLTSTKSWSETALSVRLPRLREQLRDHTTLKTTLCSYSYSHQTFPCPEPPSFRAADGAIPDERMNSMVAVDPILSSFHTCSGLLEGYGFKQRLRLWGGFLK